MATSTGNFVCDNSTLTNFKAWAQAISNALSAFGWLQTADTGQVNWGTIGSVPSSTYVYEIWKTNDSLTQLFLKMEYGFSSTQVAIKVTVGTGSNGSGTITGTIAPTAVVITNGGNVLPNQGAATTFSCYLSGDAGEFRFLMWTNNAVNTLPTFFCIERSKDATGAKTGDYWTVLWGSQAVPRQQTIRSSGLIQTLETCFVTFISSNNNTTGSFNGTVAAFPFFPIIGEIGNPMLGVAAVISSDVSDGATVTVASMYGSTHTYISCKRGGNAFTNVGSQVQANQAGSLLMRYE